MAGQVAAIDRRHIERWQRQQGLGVIPVVEMATVLLQAGHRGQRLRRALEQPPGREIAEVVGREIGQQRQPHVGRRGAMGYRGDAVFLKVVGRQPVIVRADETVEEGPGPPRQVAQEEALFAAQRRRTTNQRPADPPGDDRGNQPEDQDRPRHGQR